MAAKLISRKTCRWYVLFSLLNGLHYKVCIFLWCFAMHIYLNCGQYMYNVIRCLMCLGCALLARVAPSAAELHWRTSRCERISKWSTKSLGLNEISKMSQNFVPQHITYVSLSIIKKVPSELIITKEAWLPLMPWHLQSRVLAQVFLWVDSNLRYLCTAVT